MLQGVEAVLKVLHDCYGFSHPGGLFLAAVDLMLEKHAVVKTVMSLLEQCRDGEASWHQTSNFLYDIWTNVQQLA